MATGSPTGIFRDYSLEDLQAIKASALSRIVNGDTTSLSGAGKSKGKNYSMSAEDVLREAEYAIQLLTGTQPPRSTHFNVSGQCDILGNGGYSW